jgi:hypothetical protein
MRHVEEMPWVPIPDEWRDNFAELPLTLNGLEILYGYQPSHDHDMFVTCARHAQIRDWLASYTHPHCYLVLFPGEFPRGDFNCCDCEN